MSKDLLVAESAYKSILDTIGSSDPELGGILGTTEGRTCCEHFILDEIDRRWFHMYRPNVDYLNACLRRWDEHDIELTAFVHSHASIHPTLSTADLEFGKALAKQLDTQTVYMVLVVMYLDKLQEIKAYRINADGGMEECSLLITPDS